MNSISKIFRGDRVIWMVYIFLCVVSLVESYGATKGLYEMLNRGVGYEWYLPVLRQGIALLMGLAILLLVKNVSKKWLSCCLWLLPIGWIALMLMYFFELHTNGFIHSNIIRCLAIMQFCFLAAVAFLLARNGEKRLWTVVAISAVTLFLIFCFNMFTAFMLLAAFFVMLCISDVSRRKVVMVAGIFIVLITLLIASLYIVPNEYHPARASVWKHRISAMFGQIPESEADSYNYQTKIARVAIENGGIIGVGPGNCEVSRRLPQAHSDFVYSVVCEELGIVGGVFVALLYILLLFRAALVATGRTTFERLLVWGCALLIVIKAFVHIGINLHLLPVGGVSLPLISIGYSEILITSAFFGVMLNISERETV